jgi:23S rRNA (uracil1939-C5)-methyltransferase
MDPPRSGSTKEFIDSVKKTSPDRVVYISCNPETLARDLKLLTRNYKVERIVPFDMFPFTSHCEVVVN